MTGSFNPDPESPVWAMASCHVPGSGHLERLIPCQDRAGAWVSPRPCLMALDGRGSARLSQLGAMAALAAVRQAIEKWELELSTLLDQSPPELAAVGWRGLAQMLYHVAASEQTKLAGWYEAKAGEFEFTLTIGVVGTTSIGWLTVGDSPLVILKNGILGLTAPLEDAAFANQTTFVSASPSGDIGLRGGLIPTKGVEALIAMTDGTASRLIHLQDQVPAIAVAEIAKGLASGEWPEDQLESMLKDPSWDRVTRDDRSIALLALQLPKPETPVQELPAQIPVESANPERASSTADADVSTSAQIPVEYANSSEGSPKPELRS
ncbi:MAG: protein phosphatase 2C domain-containing protein [Verrucomicrobiota bacterium]